MTLAALVVAACGADGSAGGATSGGTAVTVSSGSAVLSTTDSGSPRGALLTDLDCPDDSATGFTAGLAFMPPRPEPYGASSPEEAANSPSFGVQPEFRGDSTSWTTVAADSGSVTLEQGSRLVVDVIRLPDGSWYVISGQRCTARP